MLRKFRKYRIRILYLIAVLCFLPHPSFAQNLTTVTATITDPSGLPYSNASIQAQLLPTGITPTIGGIQVSGFTRANADVNGTFSMNLASNAAIDQVGTQWQFSVNVTGIAPPNGTGPQFFSVTLTISGASQNISTNLNAVAPALGRGGSGAPTFVTSNPATCVKGTYFYNTVTNQSLYCIATNTLAAVGDYTGTGPGTTPTAAAGQPAFLWGYGSGGYTTSGATAMKTTQGNTLLVITRCNGCTLANPTDTQGNSYSLVSPSCSTGAFVLGVYVASNIVGGSDTITMNFTGGSQYLFSYLELTPSAFDAVSTCANATSTAVAGTNVTPTNANDLIILAGLNIGNQNLTATAPAIMAEPVSNNLMAEYLPVQSNAPISLSGTLSASFGWAAVDVAMKGLAPTVVGGSPTLAPASQRTPLGTITSGNQVVQFQITPVPVAYSNGKLNITVTGTATSIWGGLAGAVGPTQPQNQQPPLFTLEATQDGGTSWTTVYGLSKDFSGTSPTSSAPPFFSGEYDIQGLSGAWFRFSVTNAFAISNLVVSGGLG